MENDLNENQLGILNYLKTYIPHFVKLLNPSKKILSEIYNIFIKYEKNIYKNYPQDTMIETKGSLAAYLYIMETQPQEKIASILKYLDSTCKNVLERLPYEKIKIIKKEILLPMIKVPSPTQSRFTTALGELSVLDQFITSDVVQFVNCEEKLPNNKTADLYITISNKKIFIEVCNIIGVKSSLLSNKSDLLSFFGSKLTKKRDEKLEGLTGNECDFVFYIQPVVWGDIDKLLKFQNFFDDFHKNNPMFLSFDLLGQYRDKNNDQQTFIFQTIKDRFKEIQNCK